jgi:sulfite exporter TauE/SafE
MSVMPLVGTAWVLGTLGSVHCVAMCGGIAGALSMARGDTAADRPWLHHACYGIGRIASYAVAGTFVGSIGFVLGGFIGPEGMLVLRVGAALLLVLLGLQLAGWFSALAPLERAGAALWRRAVPLAELDVRRTGVLRSLALGAAWGWLPCGLVYSTLAWAGASGDPAHAALVMAAFGAGTLPGVWLVGVGAARFSRVTRARGLRRLAGAMVIATALWTLAGALSVASGDRPSCHDESVAARKL